jgi:hypothetical protein
LGGLNLSSLVPPTPTRYAGPVFLLLCPPCYCSDSPCFSILNGGSPFPFTPTTPGFGSFYSFLPSPRTPNFWK